MTRPPYKVRRLAWQYWEAVDGVPHLLTDVVDALATLPPEELDVRRMLRPPAVLQVVSGVVFGRRFTVTGIRDGDGNWLEVWNVEVR